MIARLAAWTLAAYACAFGQLQLTDLATAATCNPAIAIDLGDSSTAGVSVGFRLSNPGTSSVMLKTLKIAGVGFGITSGPQIPATIAAGHWADFEIVLTPSSAGVYSGTLWINQDSYLVYASVAGSTFRITVDPPGLASGQQANLSIEFLAPAAVAATGTVTMDFQATGRAGDPGIGFVSPSGKTVPFTIARGETTAKFQGEASTVFQTGTTAGTLIFTAQLGDQTEKVSFPLAPAVVAIDDVRLTSSTGQLNVAVTAFDNTRSASQVRLTFYDSNGRALGGGPVLVNVADKFQSYFQNPPDGGMFILRAAVAVTGDTSQVASADVGFTNSIGSSTSANVKMTK